MRFAQVLGVLRKTNRDLRSPHWNPNWVPTHAEYAIVLSNENAMRESAEQILRTIGPR